MQIFNTIREFFWPILERMPEELPRQFSIDEIQTNDENLEKALDLTLKRYEAEEDRRKGIETKSSLFIGVISVVTTVSLGITSVLLNDKRVFSWIFFVLISLTLVFTIYMLRTIWFAIKALERKNYHTLSPNDFWDTGKKSDYQKKLILLIASRIANNVDTINEKVDNMMMAQEYFKRGITVMSLYPIIMFIILFTLPEPKTDRKEVKPEQVDKANCLIDRSTDHKSKCHCVDN